MGQGATSYGGGSMIWFLMLWTTTDAFILHTPKITTRCKIDNTVSGSTRLRRYNINFIARSTSVTTTDVTFYPIPSTEVDWGKLALSPDVHTDEHSPLARAASPYMSTQLFHGVQDDYEKFVAQLYEKSLRYNETMNGRNANIIDSSYHSPYCDPFWEQIKLEAQKALATEPQAGPQLYQGILSQASLLRAVCTVVANKIATELMPATQIKNLFLELLQPEDEMSIRLDLQAAATRSQSIDSAMAAVLFHNGFHALVSYRVAHRLWQAERVSLAYYMQSVVSRTFSADLHPACKMGYGLYLRVGVGVVIGETAVVGNDVCILEGVTLGGTGKESGNRHPKVGNGVIIQDGGTVLGNIPVGDGSTVTAKAIVTKPIPPLGIVAGVPAKVIGYQSLDEKAFEDNLQHHLIDKYLDQWRELYGDKDTKE